MPIYAEGSHWIVSYIVEQAPISGRIRKMARTIAKDMGGARFRQEVTDAIGGAYSVGSPLCYVSAEAYLAAAVEEARGERDAVADVPPTCRSQRSRR